MRILVPVDGSPPSLRAVSLVIGLAKVQREPPHIILLNVQDAALLQVARAAAAMLAARVEEEIERGSEQALKPAIEACQAAGVSYTARSETGSPAATIDRIAREEKVDQIVMGTRGMGGIRGLALGSISTQVLHLAEVPVTLVK
jgi:nucleotide-binding universal stress UspA family protein